MTSPPLRRIEFHEFLCWLVAKQDKRMFTWASRGPDKRRECTGYGYRYKGMSVLAAEDGVRPTVNSNVGADSKKVVSCPWTAGRRQNSGLV